MTIARAAHAIWLSRANGMTKVNARILARAALGAIAEPTPEMVDAMAHAVAVDLAEGELRGMWHAAHAAMVKEKGRAR